MSIYYAKNVPKDLKAHAMKRCIDLECDLADYTTALILRDRSKEVTAKEIDQAKILCGAARLLEE